MADYELIGLNEATPDLRAPTSADRGVVEGGVVIKGLAELNGGADINGDPVATVSRTNPLQLASRVAMTAAASGSRGWLVQDNPQVNFGTGDRTFHYSVNVDELSQDLTIKTLASGQAGYNFQLSGGTTFSYTLRDGTNPDVSGSVAISYAIGYALELTVGILMPTASTNGSVTLYSSGVQAGTAQTITAGTLLSTDRASSLYIGGTNDRRRAARWMEVLAYNRLLSAADVLSLSINGVDPADVGGSQTLLNTSSATNSATRPYDTFSGASATGFSAIKTQTSLGAKAYLEPSFAVKAGNRVKVDFTSTINSGGSLTIDLFNATTEAGQGVSVAVTGGAQSVILVAASDGTVKVGFSNTSGSTIDYSVSGASVKILGATAHYNAQDAQSNTGQVFDSSGNGNHALLPSEGATVLPRKLSGEVRWTNTWDGTHELQYIGGTNQAILPANAYIESIVGTVSGATPHDIIIGDGSDADRYVTITTGLAAGTTTFTLANRTTDGTNLKLTVDPDTSATMSIAWVIRYTYLEN